MNIYIIVKEPDGYYLVYSEDGKKRLLNKNEVMKTINKTFNQEINRVLVKDDDMVLYYDNFKVRIQSYKEFLEQFKDLEFVQEIIDCYEIENYEKTKNNKVDRNNTHTEEIVGAFILAGLTVVSTLIIHNGSKSKIVKNPSIQTSTIQNNEYGMANYEIDGTYVITQPETTTEETTTELTTEPTTETTTQETTTEETTVEKTTEHIKTLSGYNYKNDYADGFVVTSGNKTYSLSDEDFDFMCACVMAEGGSDQDEALAVASVILNRCDEGTWGGNTPREVLESYGQFQVYSEELYVPYLNGNVPNSVKNAVSDSLNGIRNNEYEAFRSNDSYNYGGYMLTDSGNRYKNA